MSRSRSLPVAPIVNRSGLPVRSLENANRSPSGAQAGSRSSAALRVKFFLFLPMAFIVHTSRFPAWSLTNAILVPFGDHAGCVFVACVVSRVGAEPSARIVQMCRPPVRSLVKASFDPSGDQAGSPSKAGLLDKLTGLLPSASTTQTSAFPVRSLVKASFDPSGDQAGSVSLPADAVRFVWWSPSQNIVQMSAAPVRSDTNATRPFPCGAEATRVSWSTAPAGPARPAAEAKAPRARPAARTTLRGGVVLPFVTGASLLRCRRAPRPSSCGRRSTSGHPGRPPGCA